MRTCTTDVHVVVVVVVVAAAASRIVCAVEMNPTKKKSHFHFGANRVKSVSPTRPNKTKGFDSNSVQDERTDPSDVFPTSSHHKTHTRESTDSRRPVSSWHHKHHHHRRLHHQHYQHHRFGLTGSPWRKTRTRLATMARQIWMKVRWLFRRWERSGC